MQDVTFKYAEGVTALDGVSLRLEPGRTLGVVGRTGSGKSTLARLMLRFHDPSAGRILIGGTEVRDAGLDALRGRVALVTQEVQLFKATVRDNLTMFDSSVPDERVLRALEDVRMVDWLRAQRGGLDAVLGSGGSGMSAGQAQLMAFARVLLRQPGLVILDEASSKLDPATEALLEEAVGRILRGRTAIIIAHRLSTLDRADDILVLENGRVAEAGERVKLAADPESRFSRLLRFALEEMLA